MPLQKYRQTCAAGTERDCARKPYIPKHYVHIIKFPKAQIKRMEVNTHACVCQRIKKFIPDNFLYFLKILGFA
jgi:hypothetical protein